MSSHDKEAVRAERTCKGCGHDVFFCDCPPPAQPARPAWIETYPPLHCMICGTSMFKLPYLRSMPVQMTCSDACKDEFTRRYYSGTVLNRPYERKTS